MFRSLRALHPYAWLCVLGSACTPLEPTRVVAPADASMPNADAGPGAARDDGGGPGPGGGAMGSDSLDGSTSGGDGAAPDGAAGSPPTSGRCEGDGEMVDVAAGDFLRGDSAPPESAPPQLVAVDSFSIDRSEVTVIAYADCVEAGACAEPTIIGYCNWGVRGRDCHPINCVTWEQADAYCAWAGERLPTETEWEFAARGPTARWWPWGDGDPGTLAHYNGSTGTAPVGSYPLGATPEGVLDMAGNVWEWTSSTWCDSYEPTAACDPSRHVGRGGGWETGDFTQLRTHYREPGPTEPADRYGFRCAK